MKSLKESIKNSLNDICEGKIIHEAVNDEYSKTEQHLRNGEPTKKMIYISGQITGMEREDARELFRKASEIWLKKGWLVVNPMEHEPDGWSWGAYMRMDIKMLCDCTAIYMMKNYKNSKGALCELMVAEQLGLKIFYE